MKTKAVFKPYMQHQGLLLPPSLEELIPQDHIVRVVNDLVDGLDIEPLVSEYKGGGTSSYHPRMMLKAWVFGYVMKVHSCRRLAKALREHIPFMWLSGMQQPDFRTLNDFRTKRMKEVISDVFKQVVMFCVEEKYIDLSELFTDGTKYQANGNKHKAVWKKNTERYKEGVLNKLDELLAQIDEVNETENKKYGSKDLEETGSHAVTGSSELNKKITELSKKINEQQTDKKKKKQIEKAAKEIEKQAEKLARYENQEAALAGRNSCHKTDKDATMMRSKDGQLLPCYNVQNSCQNQIIVHYTVGQNANDATEFKAHLESMPQELKPDALLADSIYGTEVNYELLEKAKIQNYLMYPSFHAEQKRGFSKKIFRKENFPYNEITDSYTCPNGQPLTLIWEGEVMLRNKTKTYEKHYQAKGCAQCPFRAQCCKSEKNRTITFRPRLEYFKQQARTNLTSEKGIKLRKQRGVDAETPFADIKHNQGHRRFELRGLKKVTVEMGWINLAHNVKKINTFMKKAA
ncbi:MAG: IS1182 family transposase [Candidatus Paceibacterota bacterium]